MIIEESEDVDKGNELNNSVNKNHNSDNKKSNQKSLKIVSTTETSQSLEIVRNPSKERTPLRNDNIDIERKPLESDSSRENVLYQQNVPEGYMGHAISNQCIPNLPQSKTASYHQLDNTTTKQQKKQNQEKQNLNSKGREYADITALQGDLVNTKNCTIKKNSIPNISNSKSNTGHESENMHNDQKCEIHDKSKGKREDLLSEETKNSLPILQNIPSHEIQYSMLQSWICSMMLLFIGLIGIFTVIVTCISIQNLIKLQMDAIRREQLEITEKKIQELHLLATDKIEKEVQKWNTTPSEITLTENQHLQQEIEQIIDEKLFMLIADKVNKPDFALKTMGAEITNHSPSYKWIAAKKKSTGFISFFQQFIPPGSSFKQNPPHTILDPDLSLGNCWAFAGTTGYVTIRLPNFVLPESFTIDHVPATISPDISSAIKNFRVFGTVSDEENSGFEVLLGEYQYDISKVKMPTQNFPVLIEKPPAFNQFTLRVLDNQGHDQFTCIYRFRIHGSRVDSEELSHRKSSNKFIETSKN